MRVIFFLLGSLTSVISQEIPSIRKCCEKNSAVFKIGRRGVCRPVNETMHHPFLDDYGLNVIYAKSCNRKYQNNVPLIIDVYNLTLIKENVTIWEESIGLITDFCADHLNGSVGVFMCVGKVPPPYHLMMGKLLININHNLNFKNNS